MLIVDDGKNGFLVEEDEDLFAKTILKLLRDDRQYQQMKESALKKGEEMSIEKMTFRLLGAYRDLEYGDEVRRYKDYFK